MEIRLQRTLSGATLAASAKKTISGCSVDQRVPPGDRTDLTGKVIQVSWRNVAVAELPAFLQLLLLLEHLLQRGASIRHEWPKVGYSLDSSTPHM